MANRKKYGSSNPRVSTDPKSKKASSVGKKPSTMKLQDGRGAIKKGPVKSKTSSKTTDVSPKGTYKIIDGKRYRSTGGGNWEGAPKAKGTAKYKKRKMKPKTNYKSTRSKKGRSTYRKG